MRLKKYGFSVLGSAFILLLVGIAARWELSAAQPPAYNAMRSIAGRETLTTNQAPTAAGAKKEDSAIAVAPPPFSEGIFPCSACHDPKESVNTTPRKLSFHDDIVFKHDEKNRWCLDCHDAKDRDRLHLSSGRGIEFGESYKLCGQCHGPRLRDWKAGEHGKRTGSWSGRKEYLLCAHCHNPHAPRFQSLKPLPKPQWPEGLQ